MISHYRRDDWEQLREESRQGASQIAKELVQDQVAEAFNIEMQINALMNMQLKSRIEHLIRHYAQWGHLFAVDSEGEIIQDCFGNPVCLTIPSSPKDTLTRKNNLELLLTMGSLSDKNPIEIQSGDSKKNKELSKDYMHLLGNGNDETD